MDENKSVEEMLLSFVLLVIAFVISAVAAIVVRGFVLSKLWGWFIAPVFDVPMLTPIQAYGIALVLGVFLDNKAARFKDEKKTSSEIWAAAITTMILAPAFALFIGWLLKGLM